jgi:hypothetical protein
MKSTVSAGTWPHYSEWAERCVSALLPFALTAFVWENDTIFVAAHGLVSTLKRMKLWLDTSLEIFIWNDLRLDCFRLFKVVQSCSVLPLELPPNFLIHVFLRKVLNLTITNIDITCLFRCAHRDHTIYDMFWFISVGVCFSGCRLSQQLPFLFQHLYQRLSPYMRLP